MEQQIQQILNKKEMEIKERLFKIGSIESHDRYFADLFKDEINLTEEEEMSLEGLYIIAGHYWGKRVDDKLTNLVIKWILTGEKTYYESLKDWFRWIIRERVKEHKKRFAQFNKNEEKKKEKEIGYIYILKSKDICKIGRAKYPKERIKTYRTENPFGIRVIFQKEVDDYIRIEESLLNRFKDKQIKGEWFKLNKEDILWIKKNL